MKRCNTLGMVFAALLSLSVVCGEEYYATGSNKRRKNYDGEKCSVGYETDCGYGYTCGKHGECEVMLDQPHPWVRRSVDQEDCAASQLIATVMALDNRRVAYGAVSSIRDDPSNQASLQYWIDCFKPGDHVSNCDGGRNPSVVHNEIMKRLTGGGGLPSEYNLKFAAQVSKKQVCSGSGFRFQETVNYDVQMREKEYAHYLNLRDKVIAQGATVVHIKVFPEILLHGVDDPVLNSKPQSQDEFVGYHSVVVDGVGTYSGGSRHYYLLQSSWGPNYGLQGRIRIDAQTLYDHYLARRGALESRAFPVIGFAATDLNHLFYKLSKSMPEEQKGEFKKEFESKQRQVESYLEGRSESLSLMSGYRDMNEGLNDVNEFEPNVIYTYDQKGDVPRLKLAMRVAMDNLKKKYRNHHFRANYLVQADISVAAGRKYHLIMQVDKWKYSDKDRINNVEPIDRFFYKTKLWIPMRGWSGNWPGVVKMTDEYYDREHEPAIWSYVYYKVLDSEEWSIHDSSAIKGSSTPTSGGFSLISWLPFSGVISWLIGLLPFSNPIAWIPFPKITISVLFAFFIVWVDDGRKQYRDGRSHMARTLNRNAVWEAIDNAVLSLNRLRAQAMQVNQRAIRQDKHVKKKPKERKEVGGGHRWDKPL